MLQTPLRRRAPSVRAVHPERRRQPASGPHIAALLERQLEHYRTSAEMLTCVRSLLHASHTLADTEWTQRFRSRLERAEEILRGTDSAAEAVASLSGYERFMDLHGGEGSHLRAAT